MAIRLRAVDGHLIAVCAARSVAKPGDVYLDDEQHHALAVKFDQDFGSEYQVEPWSRTDPNVPLMAREESDNPARDDWDACFGPHATRDPAPAETRGG